MKVLLICLLICFVIPIFGKNAWGNRINSIVKIRGGRNSKYDPNPRQVPNREYDYDESNDEYQTPKHRGSKSESTEDAIVRSFIASESNRVLVAISSAISLAIVIHFILSFILGRSWTLVDTLAGILGGVFVYIKGEFGDFSRALGVFTILILKEQQVFRCLPKLISQTKACFMLSSRRPFPPTENPWQYRDSPNSDFSFNMLNTLLTLSFLGFVFGWNIVKPIPLFPSWLGGLIVMAMITFSGTIADGRGDILRYIAYLFATALSEIKLTANDVQLTQKTAVILSHTLFFMNDLDRQYNIMNNLKYLMAEAIRRAMMMMYGVKGNDSNDNYFSPPPSPPSQPPSHPRNHPSRGHRPPPNEQTYQHTDSTHHRRNKPHKHPQEEY